MSYQVSTITSMNDIPPLVASFAAVNGWTVGGTVAQPTFRRADDATALTFRMTAGNNSVTQDYSLALSDTSTPGRGASTFAPRLNGGAIPALHPPTKLHLFAAATPQPFCAIVIEFGFNNFRHLYLGNMQKIGTYVGGEIVASQQAPFLTQSNLYPISFAGGRYMFQASGAWGIKAQAGGVRVNHANNPDGWRSFFDPSGTPMQNAAVDSCLGGFNDRINDPYIFRGRNSFAGAQVLSPVNLYAPLPITNDRRFVPIGKPSGVRLVNMSDLEPGARVAIGAQHWRVFPATRKSDETFITVGTGLTYPAFDASYVVGYAYPED